MLKIKIDLTNPAHVSAAAAFFNELNSIEGANKGVLIKGTAEETVEKEIPARTSAKMSATKTTAPKTEAPQAEKPQAEKSPTSDTKVENVHVEVGAEKPQADGEVSMVKLRELTTAITKHEDLDKKKAAKQWLKDNGFNNVPGITTDKYKDCFDAFTKILNG